MLDKLIIASIKHRIIVLCIAVMALIGGTYTALNLPVDVFPDLTAPTVTIIAEAHGMAPEEVESLVTFPVETAVNGASGIRRVRSTSMQGFSTVWVEFDWGTDIYKARQIVNEKLQSIRNVIPEGVDQPVLAPVTALMGEIMTIGLTSPTVPMMDLRSYADFDIKRRLLAVPGVASVKVYGGEVKQYQVRINPYFLAKFGITLTQVLETTKSANKNAAGGFYIDSGQEYLIRGLGRIRSTSDLEYSVITIRNGVPILLRDIGDVQIGPATPLGIASINQEPGILIVISKQPDINTLTLTEQLEETLDGFDKSLPEGIVLHKSIFKAADFINLALDNLLHAIIYGAILVVFILMIFLSNIRSTVISVIAIPLSLVTAILCFRLLDLSINTMTLGGMAIAIGILVDDAIIYIENVYRRLKENAVLPQEFQLGYTEVIMKASKEIRTPIAMATFIIVVVFLPLFFLSGLEGRMLIPLGSAYAISIFASLLVAVTVTPALSSILFHNIPLLDRKESIIVQVLKKGYEPLLRWSFHHRGMILGFAFVLVVTAVLFFYQLGRSFLPEFNEGTFNISIATIPGTSLQESNRIGLLAEKLLMENPAVTSVSRRTGRTEHDEHSLGSHAAEIEVKFDGLRATRQELEDDFRRRLSRLPGTVFIIGQPISHRIDHMLSGTRANIAIKIFGPDLIELRRLAERIKSEMESIPGIVDLSVDQQIDIPQVRIRANRQKMALYGLHVGDIEDLVDIGFLGTKTSDIYEGQNQYDLQIRFDESYRNNLEAIGNSLIDTPTGAHIPLNTVTDISIDRGPNYISRENVQRKIVVQANVSGEDLLSVVETIQHTISERITLPEGYFIDYGGQFRSAVSATRIILMLSLLSVLAIFVALFGEFGSLRQVILVMTNLPLALIGGVVAIYFTDGIITVASLVGFITLFGIAVRNGIIMVSHYNHLIREENKSPFDAVLQGSLERLNPIMMTALTTGLALFPLALAAHQPGSEIQSPIALVILGGLITATFLNMIIIPILFLTKGFRLEGNS